MADDSSVSFDITSSSAVAAAPGLEPSSAGSSRDNTSTSFSVVGAHQDKQAAMRGALDTDALPEATEKWQATVTTLRDKPVLDDLTQYRPGEWDRQGSPFAKAAEESRSSRGPTTEPSPLTSLFDAVEFDLSLIHI